MDRIDDNIFVETGYQGSNNSIVRTDEGLVLIDAPLRPTDAVAWRRIVDSHGEGRYLINTDHHPDHTFGNHFLPGVVVAHRGTLERMREEAAQDAVTPLYDLLGLLDPDGRQKHLHDYSPRLPAITFDHRMSLHLGGIDFELIHAPGHTLNTIAVHIPAQGVAFVGDAVCEAGIPSFIDANIYDWRDTVDMIERLGARWLVTGHGEVCGPEVVPVFRDELEQVIGEVERRMDLGQARDQIAAEVTYEDRIHTCVNGWTGFPDKIVSMIISKSIERVYDDISARRQTRRPVGTI